MSHALSAKPPHWYVCSFAPVPSCQCERLHQRLLGLFTNRNLRRYGSPSPPETHRQERRLHSLQSERLKSAPAPDARAEHVHGFLLPVTDTQTHGPTQAPQCRVPSRHAPEVPSYPEKCHLHNPVSPKTPLPSLCRNQCTSAIPGHTTSTRAAGGSCCSLTGTRHHTRAFQCQRCQERTLRSYYHVHVHVPSRSGVVNATRRSHVEPPAPLSGLHPCAPWPRIQRPHPCQWASPPSLPCAPLAPHTVAPSHTPPFHNMHMTQHTSCIGPNDTRTVPPMAPHSMLHERQVPSGQRVKPPSACAT